jgi:hypothetical protein
MCQAVLNRLEPGKISMRDTSKKRVAIVKTTANQCIGNTSSRRYFKYLPIEAELPRARKFDLHKKEM